MTHLPTPSHPHMHPLAAVSPLPVLPVPGLPFPVPGLPAPVPGLSAPVPRVSALVPRVSAPVPVPVLPISTPVFILIPVAIPVPVPVPVSIPVSIHGEIIQIFRSEAVESELGRLSIYHVMLLT